MADVIDNTANVGIGLSEVPVEAAFPWWMLLVAGGVVAGYFISRRKR